MYLHRDKLLVWHDVVKVLYVFYAKTQFGRIRIVGQHIDNSSWKREHHVTDHFHLTPCLIATTDREK